jgi:nucleoid DNA-binding protein
MKQSHLIKLIANDTGITYETVRRIVRKITRYIGIALENDDTVTLGFGTFSARVRAGKPVRNFQTGEPYMLPPSHKLKFSPSNYLTSVLKRKDKLANLEFDITTANTNTNNVDDDTTDEEE